MSLWGVYRYLITFYPVFEAAGRLKQIQYLLETFIVPKARGHAVKPKACVFNVYPLVESVGELPGNLL